MMWLKGCHRCRGDLYLERDVGSSRVVCLQCGYVATEAQERGVKPVGSVERIRARHVEPVTAA